MLCQAGVMDILMYTYAVLYTGEREKNDYLSHPNNTLDDVVYDSFI